MKISQTNNFIIQKSSPNLHFHGNKKEDPFKNTYIMPDSFARRLENEGKRISTDPPKKPLFKKEPKRGTVFDKRGKVLNKNTTYMFRYDVDWDSFGDFLSERFKDYKKVNVYNYAASTGAEPYSLSILLQIVFGKDAQKFFPIYAKDIDKTIIIKT